MRFLIMLAVFISASVILSADDNFKYDSKGKRDPFVPLVSGEGAHVSDAAGISGVKDIRLEGIVWDDTGGSVAIINGEIFEEGDELGSVKISEIRRSSVLFDLGDEKISMELNN